MIMAVRRWPYVLDWYNGFSPDQRRASLPIQKEAVQNGTLIHPVKCSICGFSDPTALKGRGYIFAHLENYDRPLEIHPACKRCHAAIHARFKDPPRWTRIARDHYRSRAWFTLLSMDPASQRQSFWITYPDGLPPNDERSIQRSLSGIGPASVEF